MLRMATALFLLIFSGSVLLLVGLGISLWNLPTRSVPSNADYSGVEMVSLEQHFPWPLSSLQIQPPTRKLRNEEEEKESSRQSSSSPTTTLILNMGLPRTGSLAFHRYLECNGICSYHYCCVNQGGYDDDQHQKRPKTQFPCHNMDLENEILVKKTRSRARGTRKSQDGSQTCGACIHANLLRMMTSVDSPSGDSQEQQQQPHPNIGHPVFDGCGRVLCQTQTNNNNTIVGFTQFDVETSDPFSWFLPQHFALPLLYNPNNHNHKISNVRHVWILPYRSSPNAWATSVLHWHSVTKRLFRAFSIHFSSSSEEEQSTIELLEPISKSALFQALHKGILRSESEAEWDRRYQLLQTNVYQAHLDRVRSFVKEQNKKQLDIARNNKNKQQQQQEQIYLIEVNVDDTNAGSHLTNALSKALGSATSGTADDEAVFSLQSSCWKLNVQEELDEDWKNFSFSF
ncbi:hypothetical protein ACA910_016375 [Epithemia clementina (nom. ined.)]